MQIDNLQLHTIYTSRVNPTVEAAVNGHRAAAPSGASTGSTEAYCHVPDNLDRIEAELRNTVVGQDMEQDAFDAALQEIDGSDRFRHIGAVAVAASAAFYKAATADLGGDAPFPYPAGNLVGGGAHGGTTSIQEFLLIPDDADSIPEALELLAAAYHEFRDRYGQRIRGTNDEAAYITDMDDNATLDAVSTVAEEHGLSVGVDMAATEYWDAEQRQYRYSAMDMAVDPQQQKKFVEDLIDRYGLVYVEDPFHEDDFEHHAQLMDDVTGCLIVGDDLFTTSADRIDRGAALDAGNAAIIKPNQVGTVTGTLTAIETARRYGMTPAMSHRSGETTDPFIADLAVDQGVPLLKAGIGGIRVAKNNQLLRRWRQVDAPVMADVPW